MERYLWHEQEEHRNLYASELNILKNGFGGDFELVKLFDVQETNGRISAIGFLKYDMDRSQAIRINFPPKYPYSPPVIITLNIQLDQGQNIIAMQLQNFGKGNQYNDGSMCLFRKELWNKDQHGLGWVLRRAQEWLKYATSPEGFPKDKIVEEIPAHLPHVGQVLLPKNFVLNQHVKVTNIVLTQFKPNYYILEQNFIPEYPFKFKMNAEIFKCYAFGDNVTLKELFPNISPQAIITFFNKYLNENIVEGEPVRNIGLYLPGDPNPWHFFKIHIQIDGNQVFNVRLDYYLTRNVENELYLRTKDVFDDLVLKGKRVTIIGLGALGSEVAKSLGRNAVGHFNLFDFDIFELGNSVRHAADLFYIGEHKVEVVKQLILRTNPNITVNAYKSDVLNDDSGTLENSLFNSDICIVVTAEDSVDYFINDKFIKTYPIPFVFARVSVGGLSGSIQVVENNESACLRCLSREQLDKLPVPKGDINFVELSPEYGSCSSPALPGSEVDTKEVAIQVTRVALQLLLRNTISKYPKLPGTLMYWHGPKGSKGKAPFTWEIKNIKPKPDCTFCNGNTTI